MRLHEPVQSLLGSAEPLAVGRIQHEGHSVAVVIQCVPGVPGVPLARAVVHQQGLDAYAQVADLEPGSGKYLLLAIGQGAKKGGLACRL